MNLNNNEDRLKYWEEMLRDYSTQQVTAALKTLPPLTQEVLRLHYISHTPLTEIPHRINKSLTTVRTHHSRGIYKLWQYFENPAKDRMSAGLNSKDV